MERHDLGVERQGLGVERWSLGVEVGSWSGEVGPRSGEAGPGTREAGSLRRPFFGIQNHLEQGKLCGISPCILQRVTYQGWARTGQNLDR